MYKKVRKIVKGQSGLQMSPMFSTQASGNIPSKINTQLLSTSNYHPYLQQQQQQQQAANALSKVSGFIDTTRAALFGGNQNSETTQSLNNAYDAIANGAMAFSPVGTIIGGAMKVGGFVGDALTSLGVGTDQMTTTDQILDSNFMKLSPVGLVNAAFGKRTQDFDKNQEIAEEVGGSYGGSMDLIDNAVSKANKKYGLFSSGSRRRANRLINEARRQQDIMGDIMEEDFMRDQLANNMSQMNTINYQNRLNGGANLIRAAKIGMKFKNKEVIDVERDKPEIVKWQPEILEHPADYYVFLKDLKRFAPNLAVDSPEYNMFRYWELNGKPTSWYAAQFREEPMFTLEPDGYHARYVAWNENGEGEWMKSTNHPSYGHEQAWFEGFKINKKGERVPLEGEEKKKQQDFVSKYYMEAVNGKTTYKPKFKEGGSIKEPKIEESEQKNVIPEGALHKNKHHMENAEGLTKKGIPVVDNDGEQQAEIEKEELILNLEVTKKLEELESKYHSDELTKKEKDELVIEAGKLLVEQILYNTDDRTGLIDKVQ